MNPTLLEKLIEEIRTFYNYPTAVVPQVTASQIRQHLEQYNFSDPIDENTLFEDVTNMMRQWNVQISNPCYFGLFNPAPTSQAIVAEALVAAYNPQMAAWSHAPAANEIERHTLHYIASKLGFDSKELAANFTSGGSEANHSAVIVALAHHFPETLDKGIFALTKRPILYVSELAHNSFDKIIKHVGLGLDSLKIVATDTDLKLDINALQVAIEKDIAAGNQPFMVVGTAGTTSSGVIDSLEKLATICKQYQMWFHVDGAWGAAGIFSPALKPYLKGIEQADSITVDAHKWFNLTMGAGMFFTKHVAANKNAFNVRADYMPPSETDVTVPYLTTMQWSRRFIGLKLFMSLAAMGEQKFVEMIDHQTAMANYFRQKISQLGWQIVNDTPLPVVNFTHNFFRNHAIDTALAQIYDRHQVWLSSVTLRGQKVFRMCITNFKTTVKEVDILVEELEKTIQV